MQEASQPAPAPSVSEIDRIHRIGIDLASLRDSDESVLIVGFGAHGPSYDCRNGHVSITVRKGGEEATSEALSLVDALFLARAKVNRQIAAKQKAAEKAKAEGQPLSANAAI